MSQNLPIVSIIGRPNVGKSSLFNRILRRKIAVVDDHAGVTRDRNYMNTSWNGTDFAIVDTGGLLPTSSESIAQEIHAQVSIAIDESKVIVFLVEAGIGPTDLDQMIARDLKRHCADKIILAVNKAESSNAHLDMGIFLSLGLGEPIFISATHGVAIGDLLDKIHKLLKRNRRGRPRKFRTEEMLRLAFVGRPNAGKSSLTNKLLNEERMIVDSKPGTTRDAIDSLVEYEDKKLLLIDTAGLRRKSQVHNDIEYYSNLRALRSIERCDVAVVMIDAVAGLGEQDLKIIRKVHEGHKGCIICFNKWDIVEKDHKTFDKLVAETKSKYRELQYMPMVSISALTGQRIQRILELSLQIQQRMTFRVLSKELTDRLFAWIRQNPHPMVPGKEVRILGIKQQKTSFPLFNLFATNPEQVYPGYKRFISNKIYESYDFEGCPLTLIFKPVGRGKKKKTLSGATGPGSRKSAKGRNE